MKKVLSKADTNVKDLYSKIRKLKKELGDADVTLVQQEDDIIVNVEEKNDADNYYLYDPSKTVKQSIEELADGQIVAVKIANPSWLYGNLKLIRDLIARLTGYVREGEKDLKGIDDKLSELDGNTEAAAEINELLSKRDVVSKSLRNHKETLENMEKQLTKMEIAYKVPDKLTIGVHTWDEVAKYLDYTIPAELCKINDILYAHPIVVWSVKYIIMWRETRLGYAFVRYLREPADIEPFIIRRN